MRRAAVAVVALAVVALARDRLLVVARPGDGIDDLAAAPAASELAPDDGPTGPGEQFEEDFGQLPEEFSEGLDDFGTGIDDLLEQFESEFGLAGECLDLLMKYAQLMGSAFGMVPGASDRESVVAELRAALPPDLHDELQVVSDALASVERDGISGAGALADDDFVAANDAIVGWLETSCGAPSTPGEGS